MFFSSIETKIRSISLESGRMENGLKTLKAVSWCLENRETFSHFSPLNFPICIYHDLGRDCRLEKCFALGNQTLPFSFISIEIHTDNLIPNYYENYIAVTNCSNWRIWHSNRICRPPHWQSCFEPQSKLTIQIWNGQDAGSTESRCRLMSKTQQWQVKYTAIAGQPNSPSFRLYQYGKRSDIEKNSSPFQEWDG